MDHAERKTQTGKRRTTGCLILRSTALRSGCVPLRPARILIQALILRQSDRRSTISSVRAIAPMIRRAILPGTLSCALALVAVVLAASDAGLSRGDAELLKKKVADISQFASETPPKPHKTPISENELNAYLQYDGRDLLPSGVVDPTVTIVGAGRVSGRAVVDLDQVRQHRSSTGLFDPARFLTGRVPVTATGVVKAGDGMGRFELESATAAGLPIPKSLLQQIVSYYSRTPAKPSGIGLDDPFALPARIREIQIQKGEAVIVQ
jgi:hypothetical protein